MNSEILKPRPALSGWFTPTPEQARRLLQGYYRVDQPHWEFHRDRWLASNEYRALTSRWYFLTPHPVQLEMIRSRKRFIICPKGRRSGGSERWKREVVARAMNPRRDSRGRLIYSAPTNPQAVAIAWEDLIALTPRYALDRLKARRGIEVSTRTIYFRSGYEVCVAGLDHPERIEGRPIDGIVIDEFAEVKERTWPKVVRPALSTIGHRGWAALVSRPAGRNHLWSLLKKHSAPTNPKDRDEWGVFWWPSWEVLEEEEIESALDTLDEMTFREQYGAEFLAFEGRVYYAFDRAEHASRRLKYRPDLPLALCFDFNVDPGVCCYVQELPIDLGNGKAETVTAVVGEVFITGDSRTAKVCRKILEDFSENGRFGPHRAVCYAYGDVTGGARKSSQGEDGTDWDIILSLLRPKFSGFQIRIPTRNPDEVIRVNAVNSRLKSLSGEARLFVDPVMAPHVAVDLEEVTYVKGGAREIDKDVRPDLTHISDALGYYVVEKHPLIPRAGLVSRPIG